MRSLRRKVAGDLKVNRGQYIAVWLVVMLGTAFYGAMYPAGVGVRASFWQTYDDLRYLDFQVQFENAPAEVVEEAREIEGVDYAEGRLVIDTGLQLDPDSSNLITLRLVSTPDDRESDVNRSVVRNGDEIKSEDEVLLLESFANRHDIEPGDTLRIWIRGQMHELRVAGEVFNPEYMVAGRSPESPFPQLTTFGIAWLPYSQLAALTGNEGTINDIVVHLEGKASDDREALYDRVEAALIDTYGDLEGLVVLDRQQVPSGSIVQALINGNFPIMIFFSGVFLIGSTIITNILLARIISSERRRIGTMRAMGITRRELVQHYLTFGLLIGVAGGVVGSILGYLNSFWVMYTFIYNIIGTGLPGFTNVPQVPFILLGFAVAVIGSVIAGIYPAWTESATPPGVALRPAAPNTPNVISRIQLNFLPRLLRQTIRGILRVPGRSLATALGVMAGAMMVFSAFAMWDSFTTRFDQYYDAHRFDLRVDMQSFQLDADGLQSDVEQTDGVASAQASLIGGILVLHKDKAPFETIGISTAEDTPYIVPEVLEGADYFSRTDGVWIAANLRRVLGVQLGDTITLRVPGFPNDIEAEVLGVVTYTVGSPVFVPRTLVAQQAPGGVFPANTVLVRADNLDRAHEALGAVEGVLAVAAFQDFRHDMDDYLLYFRIATIIFGSFGYILTLAVLFNTVNANLREQQSELSILRALGTRGRELALMVVVELLLMIALGLVIGVPVGREIGYELQRQYFTDTYGLEPMTRTLSYFLVIGTIVIVVLLSAIPGLRGVQRVDLGQVSKSQSI